MRRKPEMLCVGLDPLLNGTRRLVLERCFTVDLADSVQDAFELLKTRPFDLVLLCYSLPDDECRAAVEFIRHVRGGRASRPRILALVEGRQRLKLTGSDEEFVPSGPAELLAKAAAMADADDDPKAAAG